MKFRLCKDMMEAIGKGKISIIKSTSKLFIEEFENDEIYLIKITHNDFKYVHMNCGGSVYNHTFWEFYKSDEENETHAFSVAIDEKHKLYDGHPFVRHGKYDTELVFAKQKFWTNVFKGKVEGEL